MKPKKSRKYNLFFSLFQILLIKEHATFYFISLAFIFIPKELIYSIIHKETSNRSILKKE